MKDFVEFCKSKRVFASLIALVSIFAVVVLYRAAASRDSVFVMAGDKVTGIRSESMDEGISLSVKATDGDVSVVQDVLLKRSKAVSDNKEELLAPSPEDEIATEITRLIREINQSEGDVLSLPNQIGDNLTLDWNKSETKGTWLLPLLFPPLLMVFMYRGEKDEIKQKEKHEVELIINELPSFNNKLVLLLGSGLVYEEALRRIAVFSEEKDSAQRNILSIKIGEIVKDAESTNRNATRMLNEFAKRKKISELKRITTIILDNQKKGTDLRSKLTLEGELLWDRRKKRAEEQGRISESKLTLPLGIMLIALLIITAGPALMQM